MSTRTVTSRQTGLVGSLALPHPPDSFVPDEMSVNAGPCGSMPPGVSASPNRMEKVRGGPLFAVIPDLIRSIGWSRKRISRHGVHPALPGCQPVDAEANQARNDENRKTHRNEAKFGECPANGREKRLMSTTKPASWAANPTASAFCLRRAI